MLIAGGEAQAIHREPRRPAMVRLRAAARLVHQEAVDEVAQAAAKPRRPRPRRAHPTTPTTSVSRRLGKSRAKLALARKLLRRSHHILRELGDAALCPVT